MDDEAWVGRLRSLVADGLGGDARESVVRPVDGPNDMAEQVPPTAAAEMQQLLAALQTIERHLDGLDRRLQQLQDDRARLVDDVAQAVIARLDARESPLQRLNSRIRLFGASGGSASSSAGSAGGAL